MMMNDYIDDDRDVITGTIAGFAHCDAHPEHLRGCIGCWSAHSSSKRIDFGKAIERGLELAAEADKEKVGATVTIGTEHVQAEGWWQRTRKGVTDFGARLRASWSWK